MVRPSLREEMKSKRGAATEPDREKDDNEEEKEEYFLKSNIDAPFPSKDTIPLPINEDNCCTFILVLLYCT